MDNTRGVGKVRGGVVRGWAPLVLEIFFLVGSLKKVGVGKEFYSYFYCPHLLNLTTTVFFVISPCSLPFSLVSLNVPGNFFSMIAPPDAHTVSILAPPSHACLRTLPLCPHRVLGIIPLALQGFSEGYRPWKRRKASLELRVAPLWSEELSCHVVMRSMRWRALWPMLTPDFSSSIDKD